jgi:predicted Zn-ribbon and HTH transcriptional regulator
MKTVNCDHCDETVVVPGKAEEEVISGETPLEHMERTGHPHKREPRLTACDNCGFAWYYTGSADRATCPNCRGKAVPGEIPDGVDDAWVKAETKSSR